MPFRSDPLRVPTRDVAASPRRRDVLAGGAGLAATLLAGASAAQASRSGRAPLDGERVILRRAVILSQDPNVGDFAQADLLIENGRIAAIAPRIEATGVEYDLLGKIVAPGFVDTHSHKYETLMRGMLGDGLLRSSDPKATTYMSLIQDVFTPLYTPQDAYLAERLAGLSQLNAGVTTSIDTSQAGHTPEHTDALIEGLAASGQRAVFAYSRGRGAGARFPDDIDRLRVARFSSSDQLLTLALGCGVDLAHWRRARQAGVPIVAHVVGAGGDSIEKLRAIAASGEMGSDTIYIHATELPRDLWRAVAATGGRVSIAPAIELQMGHGMPPLQRAIDHGVAWALSVDVETNMSADMFTAMRTAFVLQRGLENQRAVSAARPLRHLIATADILRVATLGGARVAGLERRVGSLTPGKEADLIVLDARAINVFPLNNAASAVVTLMDVSNVEAVFVAGRARKWGGRLVDVDVADLQRQAESARDALMARAGRRSKLLESCCQP